MESTSSSVYLEEKENSVADTTSKTLTETRAEKSRKFVFQKACHGHENTEEEEYDADPDWRVTRRVRTTSAGLVLCMNFGTAPPGADLGTTFSKMQCWVNPEPSQPLSTLERVAENLQTQYQRWQFRCRYEQLLDPTGTQMRRCCTRLRDNAKNGRVLLHYNGHGVPPPTNKGEVWGFNKDYTQYIPVLISDVSFWVGKPNMFVLDCHYAASLIPFIQKGAPMMGGLRNRGDGDQDTVVLAACGDKEKLPKHPHLPADLFTSCLTTPLKIALRWFLIHNPMSIGISLDTLDSIPGNFTDRRTPLGELNWVLTAITDTIAWNVLSVKEFQRFFRQDLLMAALFRNFLFAQRVMKSLHCNPVTYPPLPAGTTTHTLWESWDLAVEQCLFKVAFQNSPPPNVPQRVPVIPESLEGEGHDTRRGGRRQLESKEEAEEKQEPNSQQVLTFCNNQLSAFQVWLQFGNSGSVPVPEQLPIVLQVVLSQVHRVRALKLLAEFIDLGVWAVSLALNVGVHPYMVKLLGSKKENMKPILVFIWSKFLEFDRSCTEDLLLKAGHKHFLFHLECASASDAARQRRLRQRPRGLSADSCDEFPPSPIMPAARSQLKWRLLYVLTMLMDSKPGDDGTRRTRRLTKALRECHNNFAESSIPLSSDPDPRVREWVCMGLGTLWKRFNPARWWCLNDGSFTVLLPLLNDDHPEIRTAATWALGMLFHTTAPKVTRAREENDEGDITGNMALLIRRDFEVANYLLPSCADCSHMVRLEAIRSLARFVVNPRHWESILAVIREAHQGKKRPATAFNGNIATAGSRRSSSETHVNRSPPAAAANYSATPLVKARSKQHRALSSSSRSKSGSSSPKVPKVLVSKLGAKIGRESVVGYIKVWRTIKATHKGDPHPMVQEATTRLVRHVNTNVLDSPDRAAGSPRKMASVPQAGVVAAASAAHLHRDDTAKHEPFMNRFGAGAARAGGGDLPRTGTDSDNYDLQKEVEAQLKSLRLRSDLLQRLCQRYKQHHLARIATADKDYNITDRPNAIHEDTVTRSELAFYAKDDAEGIFRKRRIKRADIEAKQLTAPRKLIQRTGLENKNKCLSSILLFHPFQNALMAALYNSKDHDTVTMWNFNDGWDMGEQQNDGRLPNGKHIRITDMCWINEEHDSLLMVATDDGIARIWRNPCRQSHLASAFKAVPDMRPSHHGRGMVVEWQQQKGYLLATGNDKGIHVWDLHREQCVEVIDNQSEHIITSLTSWQDNANNLVAGYGDGSVRLFDLRCSEPSQCCHAMLEHKEWVVNVHRQKERSHKVVSAAVDGKIKIWDMRAAESVNTINLSARGDFPITAFVVHDYAPVFACGSNKEEIRIVREDGKTINSIRYLDGFIGSRIAPVSCLAFHPYEMKLAAGFTDDVVCLFTDKNSKGLK